MVWDLGRAMRKKEEFETARLIDFAFRLRARTATLVARELGCDADALVAATVERDHDALIAALAEDRGEDRAALEALWARLERDARRMLVVERGDPTPHRLG